MKIPTRGALRCANSTLRQVYCFLEISLPCGFAPVDQVMAAFMSC
jgi:hypothetical protein